MKLIAVYWLYINMLNLNRHNQNYWIKYPITLPEKYNHSVYQNVDIYIYKVDLEIHIQVSSKIRIIFKNFILAKSLRVRLNFCQQNLYLYNIPKFCNFSSNSGAFQLHSFEGREKETQTENKTSTLFEIERNIHTHTCTHTHTHTHTLKHTH